VGALLASLSEDKGSGGAAKRICNKMWELYLRVFQKMKGGGGAGVAKSQICNKMWELYL
jgi:hypothetical protein